MTQSRRRADLVDKHVGERVRQARIARAVSQTALADGIGLTFQQVQKYEKGINRVSPGGAFLKR